MEDFKTINMISHMNCTMLYISGSLVLLSGMVLHHEPYDGLVECLASVLMVCLSILWRYTDEDGEQHPSPRVGPPLQNEQHSTATKNRAMVAFWANQIIEYELQLYQTTSQWNYRYKLWFYGSLSHMFVYPAFDCHEFTLYIALCDFGMLLTDSAIVWCKFTS